MIETTKMSIDERRKYLNKMRIRYWQAKTKKERGLLLDEMMAVTELHRKSVQRLIKGELARKPRRRQRGKTYGIDVADVAKKIAHSLDYPCAERLQPNLVWMAENHLVLVECCFESFHVNVSIHPLGIFHLRHPKFHLVW